MSTVSVLKTCQTCQIEKAMPAFQQMRNGIGFYSSCTDCWRKISASWWVGKEFKVCKRCDHKLAIRMFQRDKYGVPYSDCIACHEVEVDAKYHREKALIGGAVKKVAFAEVSHEKPSAS